MGSEESYKAINMKVCLPRVDARNKVRGREKYAADYYGEDLLWAGVKRAGIPHARLQAIRTGAARKVPGVEAVLTHSDIKGPNRQGVIRQDQPVLVDHKIRHCGDAVALVIARDKAALAQALDLIQIECDPLPGVFNVKDALEPGAPLIHEDHDKGNLLLEGLVEKGEGRAALNRCPVLVEARFDLPRQEHAYLETESGWAKLEKDGRLVIVVSTQTPFRDRAEVAHALDLEPEKIRIIAPYPGGAFGGKDGITVQSLLALAALKCPGRPVKMWWNRQESFLASVKRHPAHLHYRLGALKDGSLQALVVDALYDTGPYDHLGGVVMTLGLEHAGGPYQIPHSSLRGRAVYTNNPVGGAFRGFGVPQVTAALEQTVDILAAKLEMDPLELRAQNLAAKGQTIPAGVSLNCSNGLPQCLQQAAAHPLWKEKQAWQDRAPLFKRRGVGVAAMMHGMGYGPVVPDVAQAKIELTAQGGFRLYSGVVDMGQGNANTYLQMAGHLLNQDPAGLGLILPDTDKTLPCGSASASRTTFTYGNALILACQDLQKSIKEQAAKILGIDDPEEIRLEPGLAGHPPSGKYVDMADLAKDMPPEQRMAVREYRAPISPDPPIADEALRLHGFAHAIFSFGVQMASVEVDELTGKIEIKDFVSITDCGRVLNPPLLQQQMHGALAQGLGYALHEDFISQEGLTLTPDLSTYIIPTAKDLPDFETSFVQANEPAGPFGLKGAGELGCDGPLPAVANALADACGVRPERFPLTPERVLLALRSEANQEKAK